MTLWTVCTVLLREDTFYQRKCVFNGTFQKEIYKEGDLKCVNFVSDGLKRFYSDRNKNSQTQISWRSSRGGGDLLGQANFQVQNLFYGSRGSCT